MSVLTQTLIWAIALLLASQFFQGVARLVVLAALTLTFVWWLNQQPIALCSIR